MSEQLSETVMRVLRGQSPDYFIYPNAAAFAAENLDPEQVAETLSQMEAGGVVEREMVEFVSGTTEDGEEIIDKIGGGYRLATGEQAEPPPAETLPDNPF